MKSLFITGVTSGIGSEVLDHAIKQNMKVTAVVRTDQQAAKLREKYPGIALYIAELSDQAKTKELASKLREHSFDYVLLNAGFADVDYYHKLSSSSVENMMEVNLLSNMRFIHALLPKALEKSTKIAVVSSLLSRIPGKQTAAYASAKAGLSHFMASLHVEYPTLPLLCIEIGGVKTPFHKKADITLPSRTLKEQAVISKRLFDALLHKTGTTTLSTDWTILRKTAMMFEGLTKHAIRRSKDYR